MEAKPLSLQSPQTIATEYGGNKQKIAQAVQMGLVDPTSGVLAGMFIDRMRNAQAQEQAPQQTVAQQVMQAKPPQVPQGVPGIPGIPTSVAPAAQAPQRAMQQPISQAPVNAADGGLMSIPVPDALFDEPNEDAASYAPGGIVAFDDGGEVRHYLSGGEVQIQDLQNQISQLTAMQGQPMGMAGGAIPSRIAALQDEIASIRNAPVLASQAQATLNNNAQVGMAGRSTYLAGIRNAQALAAPTPGLAGTYDPSSSTLGAAVSSIPTGPPDTPAASGLPGAPVPSPPNTPAPGAGVSLGTPSTAPSGGLAKALAAMQTPTTRAPTPDSPFANMSTDIGEQMAQEQKYTPTSDVAAKAAQDYFAKQLSPEEQDKNKQHDLWSTLAQIGFGMAASKSPYALQAAGEAGAAAVPQMEKLNEQRRQEYATAAKASADLENQSNAEKRDMFKTALTATQTAAQGQAQAQQNAAQLELQYTQLDRQGQQAAEQALTTLEAARIQASTPDEMQRTVNLMVNGSPAQQVAVKTFLMSHSYTGMLGNQLNANQDAEKNIEALLNSPSGRAQMQKLNQLVADDHKNGTNTAISYRQSLVDAEAQRLRQQYGPANGNGVPGQAPANPFAGFSGSAVGH